MSDDFREEVTERTVAPMRGVTFNFPAVARGESAGRYRIRALVEDTREQVFEFAVP